MSEQPPIATQQTVVIAQNKSMGIALILSILFGPLGLLYASVLGGIVLTILVVLLTIFSAGILAVPAAICAWIIAVVWSMIGVRNHNAKTRKLAGAVS